MFKKIPLPPIENNVQRFEQNDPLGLDVHHPLDEKQLFVIS